MSSTIYMNDGPHQISLTQYAGRYGRGLSLQITGGNCDNQIGYVGMTPKEARLLGREMIRWAWRERKRRRRS